MKPVRVALICLAVPVALVVCGVVAWATWERLRDPLVAIARDAGEVRLLGDSAYEVTTASGELRLYRDVTLETDRIGTIHFTTSMPRDATPASLPFVIVLAGLRTGRESLAYLDVHGQNVIAGFEYPYDPAQWERSSKVAEIGRIRRAILDVPAQVNVLADWLAEHPLVDPGRSALLGYSFGAMFVPATQRLSTERSRPFGAAILAFAGTDIGPLLEANLRVEPRFVRRALAWAAATAIHPMEPSHHLPHMQGPVLVIRGDADTRIPPELSERLAALLPETREVISLQAGHMGPHDPELTAMVVRISQKWLAEGDAIELPPEIPER
jgi:dienelactone hydrolase